jgi:NADPH-dependent glutamate synthase beta subunit-like oxidoreductase
VLVTAHMLQLNPRSFRSSSKGNRSICWYRPGARQLHFDFLRQPVEIVSGDDGAAQAVRLERTQLQQGDDGRVLAHGTGQFELVPADLVLVSIGYRSVPIEGAGFDADRGVILNR